MTLETKYQDIKNKRILGEFEYRFKKSHADHICFIDDTRLLVKNEIIRITPDLNLNFWTGIGKAEIEIIRGQKDSRIINYKYYYTRIFIGFSILLSFLLISIISMDFNIEKRLEALFLLGSIFTTLYLILFVIVLIRHRTVFYGVIRTIKNGLQH
ncbi:MAG: hypothetical protein KKB74_00565 [Bacteroidetes bacterium]|nr:hypothetical protein [Bacteroidota bacterium]